MLPGFLKVLLSVTLVCMYVSTSLRLIITTCVRNEAVLASLTTATIVQSLYMALNICNMDGHHFGNKAHC